MKWLLLLLIPASLLASPQGVPAVTVTTVGTSPIVALAANPYRGYLIMQNQGGNSCIMTAGPAAIVSPNGLIILPGQNYEMVNAFAKSAINFQCAGAGNRIVFLETNF